MSRESGRTTILHLSDVHATLGEPLYGKVDGIERMHRASDYARAAGVTPEAIVITGDLIERGHVGAYPAVARAIERLEAQWSVPVLTVLGNHDDPTAARILPGHADSHYRVVLANGLRFVLLDSSSGELGRVQLAWLAAELERPARFGTIVAIHHAPLGSPLPALAKAGLRDASALLNVVTGSDVRVVLAGHFHHPLSAVVRGVPVSVGPALAYHQVMDVGPAAVAGFDRSMFSLVQLDAQGLSASSVALEHPTPLFTSPSPLNALPIS